MGLFVRISKRSSGRKRAGPLKRGLSWEIAQGGLLRKNRKGGGSHEIRAR